MSKKTKKITDKELGDLQAKISILTDLQYKIGASEVEKNNLLQYLINNERINKIKGKNTVVYDVKGSLSKEIADKRL